MSPKFSVEEKLADAFLSLLDAKPFTQITICELCRQSGVNRSSFYRKFTDMKDFTERLCRTVARKSLSVLREYTLGRADPTGGFSPMRRMERYFAVCFSATKNELPVVKKLYNSGFGLQLLRTFTAVWAEGVRVKMLPIQIEQDKLFSLSAEILSFYYTNRLYALLPPTEPDDRYLYDGFEPVILGAIADDPLCLGLDKAFRSTLYREAVELWQKNPKDPHPFTVTAICRRAYISRALFYTKYKNIDELTQKMSDDAVRILSLAILFHALGDRESAADRPVCRPETDACLRAATKTFSLDRALPFTQKIFRCVDRIFFTVLRETKGVDFVCSYYDALDRYIFTMIHVFLHTLITGDSDIFTAFIADMLPVKKTLKF